VAVTNQIGPNGGVVDLPKAISLIVPAGFLAATQQVALSQVSEASISALAKTTTAILNFTNIAQLPIKLTMALPASGLGTNQSLFLQPATNSAPNSAAMVPLALVRWSDDTEQIDAFNFAPTLAKSSASNGNRDRLTSSKTLS